LPGGSDAQALERLVRELAEAQGMPHDDDEFVEVVAAYSSHWRAVVALDDMPVDHKCEPATLYLPRP
jgi:hypothetical protein